MHNVIHCSAGDRPKSPEGSHLYMPQSTLGQSFINNVALHIGQTERLPTYLGLPAQQLMLASVCPKTFLRMFRL